ncbi:hypothetical protein DID96_12435 [Burkholderia sp. Bp8963]|nr:hypothetical protein DID96_12435 [Burkholderia sp. Bp8963]
MALASLSTVNTCTKTYTSEFGLTSTFQFSSQGGNGTDTPRVVTASGQIPLTGLPGGQTDLLGFQLTLNRVGLAYELDGSTHSTYPSGTPLVVSHFANTVSLANATLSAWTQQGALPLTVYYAVVSNNKSHEVDVTR